MDDLLKKLSESPFPGELAHIDDAILAAVAERQSEARTTSRLLPVAAILALGVGYAGGSVLPARASAAESKMIFAETALAPSTLLDLL